MATLIAVYTSAGCVGRCDAKCYQAKHSDCDCICGGKNHGKGLATAKGNTRHLAEEWAKRYAQEKGLENYTSEVTLEALQDSLFNTSSFSQAIQN